KLAASPTIIKESRPFILDYLHKQGWATR
ncbi:hypothetical protein Q2434_17195, partial [Escherichia coli]|nr:hypothetical protein [Escherichia coli]